MSIFNSFNARTTRLNIFSNIFKNKVFIIIIGLITIIQIFLIYYGGTLFRTSGLTLTEFTFMLIYSSLVIPIDIIRQLVLRKKGIVGGV